MYFSFIVVAKLQNICETTSILEHGIWGYLNNCFQAMISQNISRMNFPLFSLMRVMNLALTISNIKILIKRKRMESKKVQLIWFFEYWITSKNIGNYSMRLICTSLILYQSKKWVYQRRLRPPCVYLWLGETFSYIHYLNYVVSQLI